MFNFTRQERQAVLFLLSIALCGMAADYFAKSRLAGKSISSIVSEVGKIDLNKADRSQLMSIPGIKEKLAGRIIDYREKQDGFFALEELTEVKGVSEAKLEKLRQYLLIK